MNTMPDMEVYIPKLLSLPLLPAFEKIGIDEKGTEVEDALGKHIHDFSKEELERYANYCINDVDLTYQLFKIPNLSTCFKYTNKYNAHHFRYGFILYFC